MDNFAKFGKSEINNTNSLSNIKNAIVTGGAGRIGSVFVKLLINNKIYVLIGSRSEKKFLNFYKKLSKLEKKYIQWSELDLQKLDQIVNFKDKNLTFIKKSNLLVNNASSSFRGSNYKYDYQNIVHETNGLLTGTIYFSEQILPLLRKQKSAKIINVASLWGFKAPKEKTYLKMNIGPTPVLAAAKAGIINYTKYLAEREKKFNLIINSLSPGWFPRKGKKSNKKYVEAIIQNIPSNRIGKLEDLISPVTFLLSNGSKYYNGQNLIVDGGYSIY